VCVKSDVVPLLSQVVSNVDCSGACGDGTLRCDLSTGGVVSAAQMDELCAATLVEDVDQIYCEVFGP